RRRGARVAGYVPFGGGECVARGDADVVRARRGGVRGRLSASGRVDQLRLRRRGGGIAAHRRGAKRPVASGVGRRLDFTLGRSGSLLAAAMLLDGRTADDTALRAFGAKTMSVIWRELDERPPLERSRRGARLGMAHGWAGYFYAALRWCAASGDALPPRLLERLHEYAALKTIEGRGAYWRSTIDRVSPGLIPGWCGGSAGQLFLCSLVRGLFGDNEW